jgi:hypothetical protein
MDMQFLGNPACRIVTIPTELSWLKFEIYNFYVVILGARDGVVVKAIRYKPAGRGFDSRWCHWNF